MSIHKLSTTILSAAALAACVPPTFYANLDDDLDIICTKEASIASHIKEETCRQMGDVVYEKERSGKPRDDDPFQTNPVTPERNAHQIPLPSSAPPPPPEGNCGGQTND